MGKTALNFIIVLMAAIFPEFLDFAESSLVLRLFANDLTPTGEETFTAFEEVRGGGYAPQPLRASSWTVLPAPTVRMVEAAAEAGHTLNPETPIALYPRTAFAFTGNAGEVYGYFLTQEGIVVRAERFPDGPYTILRDGEDIKVSLTIQG